MKYSLIKIGFVAASFFAIVLLINGCKKTGLGEVEQINTTAKDEAAFAAKIRKDVEQNGMVQRVQVNERLKSKLVDLEGNDATFPHSTNPLDFTSACGTDPNGDPWLPEPSLEFYEKQYQCGIGYKIRWTYKISWANNIVLVNPFNAANKTKGRARVRTASSILYNNTSFDIVIDDLGADAAIPGNNVFWVTCTTNTLIPVNVLNNPNAYLQLDFFIASDCADLTTYQYLLTTASANNYTVPLSSNPCFRNDNVYMNGGTGVLMFAGFDAIGNCNHQYSCDPNDPNFQEVQYKIGANGAWTDMTSSIGTPSWISGTRFLPWYSFGGRSQPLAAGTYDVQVRSRNWKYNTCPSSAGLPTASNSCFNPLWKVDSYTGIVVN